MNRRAFITLCAVSTGTVATSALVWRSITPNTKPLTINSTLALLDSMSHSHVVTTGTWSLYQLLVHCAQSVEYSMSGFPEHKSSFFKYTAGKLAFSAFSAKGKMTHPLDEKIPGAPTIIDAKDLSGAFARFKQSLVNFQAYDGQLKPHFAYGKLNKSQYEQAHVMHFNNHLQEIRFA